MISKFTFVPLLIISLFNIYSFFTEGVVVYLIFLFLALLTFKFSLQQNKYTFFEAFYFVNIFTALLPPKAPFTGVQFSYFDYLFLQNNYLDSVVYNDTFRYIGFHIFIKPLLITGDLVNLNVALFFVNFAVFYGIFNFYKTLSKKKNIFTFQILLLFFLFLINLPNEFNSLMGLGKLFLNGTAGFGSYGFRVFSPASFDLLAFIPLTYLLKNDLKKFATSTIIISSMHYYLLVLFIVMFITFIHSKSKKSYLFTYLLITLGFFNLVNKIEIFKYLSKIMISSKEYFININLIPVFSLGTLLNNGKNNKFLYYFDLENLKIFKPFHLVDNFSPTLGVYNDLASIPIEKVFYIITVIYLIRSSENGFLKSFLKYLLTIYLTSHILFSFNIFAFMGFIYPWRLIHFASFLSFVILISLLKVKIEINYKYYFLSILLIPISFIIWSDSSLDETDYNKNLLSQIELLNKEKVFLIPIDETRYLYDYGLPNVYISIYHPIDWFDQRLLKLYFLRINHYYEIYKLASCKEVENYIVLNNIKVDYIFLKKTDFANTNCSNIFKFY